MAQFVVPEHLRSEPSIILVDEDPAGCWTVEENHGRIRGRFRRREDALRFARSERDLLSKDAIVVASPARVHPGSETPETAS